ncbi:MAG: hypothetical protein AAFV69_08895 [Pseudomonadota bacterium]
MFKIPRQQPWPPTLDLATVRDTLLYMRDDMRRIPALARAADALDDALVELTVAEQTETPKLPLHPGRSANFVKWQPLRHPGASKLSDQS